MIFHHFSLNLCVNVQLPIRLGGLEGQAVFFDTNLGFSVDRIKSMATCLINQVKDISLTYPDLSIFQKQFTLDEVLQSIHYNHCSTFMELLAGLEQIKVQVASSSLPSNIKLIVIDSFSYLFHNPNLKLKARFRSVNQTITSLISIAEQLNCVVIITNELTYVNNRERRSGMHIVPCMGIYHKHRIPQRINFRASQTEMGVFYADVVKSYQNEKATAKFCVTEGGVTDV